MNIRVQTQIFIFQVAQNPVVTKLEREIVFLRIQIEKMKAHQKQGNVLYCLPNMKMVNITNALKDLEGMLKQKELELFVQGSPS